MNERMNENMGAAIHTETKTSTEAIRAHIHVHVDAVQAEIRGALDTTGAFQAEVLHRLERLETSPVPKFAAGLDLNLSLSIEMTVAPYHSTMKPEVAIGPDI